MKTMAEVVADKLADLDELTDGDGFTYSWFDMERSDLARELADALTAAGYGPVNAVAVVHVAHDTEAHARSFNEGYETAMAQELAEDPTTAQDWLDEKLANAKAEGWDECEVTPYEIRLEPGGKFWQPYKDNPYRSAP